MMFFVEFWGKYLGEVLSYVVLPQQEPPTGVGMNFCTNLPQVSDAGCWSEVFFTLSKGEA